jgi:gluconate 2-dehydrogenase alpha chain
MVTRLERRTVVFVGGGFTAALAARQLTAKGVDVLVLERGTDRTHSAATSLPSQRDELRWDVHGDLFQDWSIQTYTLRHNGGETALPIRRLQSFKPGEGMGGAANHWNGQTWRWAEYDPVLRTHLENRYGKKAIPADMAIQDWGVTYAEMEPYHDQFEKLFGIAGKAGNLRGKVHEGGNPFEGPRQNEFPQKPLPITEAGVIFSETAKELGYKPFPMPAANSPEPYTNPDGMQLGQCQFCGHCERFICVVLSSFTMSNTKFLLMAGIGTPYDPKTGHGVVGKNFCHQTMSGTRVFFKDRWINPFLASGASQTVIDEFNGDNFDHGGLGFLGGGYIYANVTNGRPITSRAVPPGTPKWGSTWKKANADWYAHNFSISAHGSWYPHRENYVDLDPTYLDAYGQPLLRMTFDVRENERKMSEYLSKKIDEIARATGADIAPLTAPRKGPYDSRVYQTTHVTGGTIMGDDPATSVVSSNLQHWDAENLFVVGASVYPFNAGYNPTGPLGALALKLGDDLNDYVARPRHL